MDSVACSTVSAEDFPFHLNRFGSVFAWQLQLPAHLLAGRSLGWLAGRRTGGRAGRQAGNRLCGQRRARFARTQPLRWRGQPVGGRTSSSSSLPSSSSSSLPPSSSWSWSSSPSSSLSSRELPAESVAALGPGDKRALKAARLAGSAWAAKPLSRVEARGIKVNVVAAFGAQIEALVVCELQFEWALACIAHDCWPAGRTCRRLGANDRRARAS